MRCDPADIMSDWFQEWRRERERCMYCVAAPFWHRGIHLALTLLLHTSIELLITKPNRSLSHHPIITVFPPSRWFFTICAHPSSLQCHVNSTAVCEQLYSLLRSVPCCILIHRSFRALNCFYSEKVLGASIGFEFESIANGFCNEFCC